MIIYSKYLCAQMSHKKVNVHKRVVPQLRERYTHMCYLRLTNVLHGYHLY